MESFVTPYSVVVYDGEHEQDKGQIGLFPDLNFKVFQQLLGQKIGLPTQQLSIMLVCRRKGKHDGKLQKVPINESTNFASIITQHSPSWEKDCHFSVFLRKSKRERRGARRRTSDIDDGGGSSQGCSPTTGGKDPCVDPSSEKVQRGLLSVFPLTLNRKILESPSDKDVVRRAQKHGKIVSSRGGQANILCGWPRISGRSHMESHVSQSHMQDGVLEGNRMDDTNLANITNYWPPFQELIAPHGYIDRQNGRLVSSVSSPHLPVGYNVFVGSHPGVPTGPLNLHFHPERTSSQPVYNDRQMPSSICEHCYMCRERNINPAPFHLCIYDRITVGFRGPSPAGPIGRPVRRVEAAA